MKEWEKAAGFKLTDKSHCPFVMKADRIEYENKRLYLVFENMEMTLTQYIKKKGQKGRFRLSEDNEIKIIMK